MVFKFGGRYTDKLYVSTTVDLDNADTAVDVEFITDEGVKQLRHGTVTWEDAKKDDQQKEVVEPVEEEAPTEEKKSRKK